MKRESQVYVRIQVKCMIFLQDQDLSKYFSKYWQRQISLNFFQRYPCAMPADRHQEAKSSFPRLFSATKKGTTQ